MLERKQQELEWCLELQPEIRCPSKRNRCFNPSGGDSRIDQRETRRSCWGGGVQLYHGIRKTSESVYAEDNHRGSPVGATLKAVFMEN